MISLTDIHYRYPETREGWDLEGVTLTIREGEFVLVCGESGSGKSTLACLFNGLIPHFFGGLLRGNALVNGLDIRETSVARLLPHVGMVLQNTDAHLFSSTVEDEIAFGLESLGVPPAVTERRIRQIAEMLRIEELLQRPPMALSGGERRLAAIGSVLCLDPPLLVLDEPFAHLDWEGMRRVRNALADLHRMGKTIVVIEHRAASLLGLISRCVIVDHGRIACDCAPSEAFSNLQSRRLVPIYPRKSGRERTSPFVDVRDLSHVRDGKQILKEISFRIGEGEVVAVVGRNGSGKTTLIRHLNGLRLPSGGSVSVAGSPLRGKGPLEMASLVGISFQNPHDQFFKNKVREELTAGLNATGRNAGGLRAVCDLFQLNDLLERSPYRLSEGQKRRVALASIVAMDPRILVIDEPTVGQDGRFLEAMAGLVISLRDRGYTVVIVTHDLEFAQACSDRWIVLHEGRKAAEGRPEDLMKDQTLIRMGAIGTEAGWNLSAGEDCGDA